MSPSAQTAGGAQVKRWTRELIIAKIVEWNDRYGEPPCSADWNPSLARWRAQEWRAERYREGQWPSTNAAKRHFDGSFVTAIRAAGLEPHRAGPRRRLPGAARPDVEQRAPRAPRAIEDELHAALERAQRAEARIAALEQRLEHARDRAERAEDAVGEARRRARRATQQAARAGRSRERVQVAERGSRAQAATRLEAVSADADARVRAADDQAEAATRDALDARRSACAAELRAAEARAAATAAERLAAIAAHDAPGATRAALAAVRAADGRTAEAEQRVRELALLLCGEPRLLSPRELAVLRDGGPSGPAVLAGALKRLARARSGADPGGLDGALADVASAAVRWRDRLA
jgi:hypothetical protein